MNFELLRAEHQTSRLGPEWLRVVEEVCREVVVSYPPRIYGQVEAWEQGIEDLVQDVVLKSLLNDRQAEYLIAQAATEQDFRRLLARQVRHVLAQRRTKTVIDQLLRRSRRLLAQSTRFDTISQVGRSAWHLKGVKVEVRSAAPSELRAAAVAVLLVPKVPYSGSVRAPKVYTDESLAQILEIVGGALPVPFDLRDLDRIFQELLTDYLPRNLESVVRQGLATERPEQEHEVTEAVNAIQARLTTEQAFIVAAKLCGLADSDLASRLEVSRPTAAKRKEAALKIVGDELVDLDSRSQERALDILSSRLATPGWANGLEGQS